MNSFLRIIGAVLLAAVLLFVGLPLGFKLFYPVKKAGRVVVEKEKPVEEPLSITEFSQLNHKFEVVFCTNKSLHWQTVPSSSKSNVTWSYSIRTFDHRYWAEEKLPLKLLEYSDHTKYYKQNESSAQCHTISLYQHLKKIPWLKYQKGYSRTTNRKLFEKEQLERENLLKDISRTTIEFYNKNSNELIFSLSTSAG